MRSRYSSISVAVVLTLFVVVAMLPSPTHADKPDKKALVKIKIVDDKENVGKYQLLIGPRGVGFCKVKKDDCWGNMKFRWIGNETGYTKITIQSEGPNKECLKPQTIELLDTGRGAEKTAGLDPDEICPDKYLAVFYSVTATGPAKDDVSEDPGVIIEN